MRATFLYKELSSPENKTITFITAASAIQNTSGTIYCQTTHIPNHRTNYQPVTRPRYGLHTVLPPVANFLLVFFEGLIHQIRGRKLYKSIARCTALEVLHDDYTIRRYRQPCHNQPTHNPAQPSEPVLHIPQHTQLQTSTIYVNDATA